ncbi:MAG: phosphoribosylpyrophosphate synthetase [Bacteroidia bacterium]
MEAYETLTEAISALRAKGYTEDFNLKQHCITCRNDSYQLLHDEFEVDQVIRFDDNTDPSDQAILYAISSKDHQLKGLLVNGYGIYSEEITNEMAEKLSL